MLSSIPVQLLEYIEQTLGEPVKTFASASGGCINAGGTITTSRQKFFLKWNDAIKFPSMLASEAKGLDLLRAAGALRVPVVVASGTVEQHQYLLLEHIGENRQQGNYWDTFGEGLAKLHRASADEFGLAFDNYMGSLRQSNTPTRDWITFFSQCRLAAQVKLAIDNGLMDHRVAASFERLYTMLPGILVEESPSLIHGDLWGGNLMTDENGNPCLIDPAVYYGNREVDLAMTMLFGGFDSSYLDAYRSVFPLQPGYHERLAVYNLYPLLVHVNLFGKSYVSQVVSIIGRYV